MKLDPPPAESDAQAAILEPMRRQARSLKGGLIYVSQVHPGIAHAVSRVCSFMAKPTEQSYTAAKRILAWLRDRSDLGCTYGRPHLRSLEDLIPSQDPFPPMHDSRDFALTCTVDSDLSSRSLPLLSDVDAKPADRNASRSQLGYEFSLAGACFEACSRRQHSVAVNTAVAELFAASTAAAILITINGVLRFVTFGILGVQPVVFWCDNEICITVAKDASSMKHVAYVARRVRFLQEMQSSDHRIISMRKVSGLANPADMLTKHLKKESFKLYAAKLYGCSPADL